MSLWLGSVTELTHAEIEAVFLFEIIDNECENFVYKPSDSNFN